MIANTPVLIFELVSFNNGLCPHFRRQCFGPFTQWAYRPPGGFRPRGEGAHRRGAGGHPRGNVAGAPGQVRRPREARHRLLWGVQRVDGEVPTRLGQIVMPPDHETPRSVEAVRLGLAKKYPLFSLVFNEQCYRIAVFLFVPNFHSFQRSDGICSVWYHCCDRVFLAHPTFSSLRSFRHA